MGNFYKTIVLSRNSISTFTSENENDSNYKIWHQEIKKPQAHYAASIGPGILKFYEEYFDLAFPLPKMDMAAIPDFSGTSMSFYSNFNLILP